jgi:serine/threonine protein kinase
MNNFFAHAQDEFLFVLFWIIIFVVAGYTLFNILPNNTRTLTHKHTRSYRFMAPEVFRHKVYNETVDTYSYGMIFFYLLVGRPPWPNLAGLDAVRKASDMGDRPNIPRDIGTYP